MKINRFIWGIVGVVALLTIAVTFGKTIRGLSKPNGGLAEPRAQSTATPIPEDKRDLSMYGSVRYEDADSLNLESDHRREASQRYDHRGWVYNVINNPATASVGIISEDVPPPLLPADESSLTVVGQVLKANAFLSVDKTGVYSEFTILIKETLKGDESEIGKSRTILADREGGVVIYPNGQRVLYQSSDHPLLKKGADYLLFLRSDNVSPNYSVLSAFELSGSEVRQIDQGRDLGELRKLTSKQFVEEVRKRINQTNQ